MKKLRNEKGFLSIEAIISMTVMLMAFLIGVGFFSYILPKQNIQEEVTLLSKKVKLEGGVTGFVDVPGFKQNLVKRGYAKTADDIKVELYKESTDGKDSTLIKSNEQTSSPLIQRNERFSETDKRFVVMKLVVEVPTSKKSILRPLSYFGVGSEKLSDKYVFVERMMSEYIGS